MIFLFYFFAAVLIMLSFRSFRGGIEYLRYFKIELTKPAPNYTPFVTIIAPCRGLDAGLEKNLSALIEQHYPDYEVIFAVDDRNDLAVPVIEEVSRNSARRSKLIIAPRGNGSSQKVENLREAVLHASDKSEAYVFVDSDARPSNDWLRYLVAPLQDKTIGATTGYRWFLSEKPSFSSEMLSAWNASIASALGSKPKTNFCWGGSMAMRRDVLSEIDMREKWRGTLSDDFAVTRAMNEAGLPIVFVPQALTATIDNCSFSELIEFTTRQMKITRVYASHLWQLSFVGSAIFCVVMTTAFLIIVCSKMNDINVVLATATILAVTCFSVGKSSLRLKAAKLALPGYQAELDKQFWTQNSLWLLTPTLFLYNSVAALFSRRLRWRGITYELKSPTETVIITD